MEDMIQLMKLKSNNDLEFIVENYNKYSISELLAVFDEIKERNMMSEEEWEALRVVTFSKKNIVKDTKEEIQLTTNNTNNDLNKSSLFMFFSYLALVASDLYLVLHQNNPKNIFLLLVLAVFIGLMYFINVYNEQNEKHSLISKVVFVLMLVNLFVFGIVFKDAFFIVLSLTSSVLGFYTVKKGLKLKIEKVEKIEKMKPRPIIITPSEKLKKEKAPIKKPENIEDTHYLDDLKFLKNIDFDLK